MSTSKAFVTTLPISIRLTWILLFVFTFMINFYWFATNWPNQRIKGATSDLTTSQLIALTNLQRIQNDLPALRPNPQLQQAAFKKAENMLTTNNFDHYYQTEEGDINPWQFINESGYVYHHAGENLAKDFYDSTTLVQAWMDSPLHRDNILNPKYQEIGIAVIEGNFQGKESTTLVVQIFASAVPPGFSREDILDQSPSQLNAAPLIEDSTTKFDLLSQSYTPILLTFTTAALTVVTGLIIFDIFILRKPKQQSHLPNKELWRH